MTGWPYGDFHGFLRVYAMPREGWVEKVVGISKSWQVAMTPAEQGYVELLGRLIRVSNLCSSASKA